MRGFLVSLLLTLPFHAFPQDDSWRSVLLLDDLAEESWRAQPFELRQEATIRIEAIGQAIHEDWVARAWILDYETRRPIWKMELEETERFRRRELRRFSGEISLDAGRYEVCYGVDPSPSLMLDLKELLGHLFSTGFPSRSALGRHWKFEIFMDEKIADIFHPFDPPQDERDAIRLIGVGDDEHVKAGFSVRRSARVRIYSLGEGYRSSRQLFDYGWIVNARTRERVWEANVRKSRHAGGASKNRLFETVIDLPPGDYVVHYITDDSHSADYFNQMPPYDPRYWGIALWAEEGEIEPIDSDEIRFPTMDPIVRLAPVGDDELVHAGFELLQDASLRILALGEKSLWGRRMADYGWILDARTREKVWEFSLRKSDHAGGAQKNRLVEEIVEFPAGIYVVYYRTDDSHAYDSWNSSPPFDPEAWGITIWPSEDDFDYSLVRPYREEDDPNILVRLTRVQDDEHRRKRFLLHRTTRIRIYAIGEGLSPHDEMADYGWIEDEDGEIVWQMEYEDTKWAGGARKNRKVDEIITLPAGRYTVHFQVDGSHAFGDWNAEPPDDPLHWGVTLFKAE